MWKFNLKNEKWTPLSIKSKTIQIARSEFGHAKLEENFIVFGGKGDDELLNDLYVHNIPSQMWHLIEIESAVLPTPRRGACLAAYEGLFFLYGGLDATGYSHEFWKFDFNTREYELLDSLEGPPPSAFSSCQIYENSNKEPIFQVYMGETSSHATSFVYEYRLNSKQWHMIKDAGYDGRISKSKAAAFMINDNLVVAGGIDMSYRSFNQILMLDITTDKVETIGKLPEFSYNAASTFYKNKIYIHGGAHSYGDLPLSSILKNDFLVIELNSECNSSSNFCIPTCSKGTYSSEGKCSVCPKGSYSDDIGAESCGLCPKGYFSNVIGADSFRTCKLCTSGYFGKEEGQAKCYQCPIANECSHDRVLPGPVSSSINFQSIQPELYEYNEDSVATDSLYFDISLGILAVILLGSLLSFSKSRSFIQKLDLYSKSHTYGTGEVMYVKETQI